MDQVRTRVQEISRRSTEIARAFPALWRRMLDAWAEPDLGSRAWLMYSASYLVQTGDIRWAIDPVRLEHRLPGAPVVNYAADLAPLSLVLLTHRHGDHLDLELIHSLRHLPILWIVPETLVRRVMDDALIPSRQIIVAKALATIDYDDIRILPFDGMHFERRSDGSIARPSVPSMGYLIEEGGRRWLFPGDIRTYAARELPCFGPVDALFAHVWLGRAAALQCEPPLLEQFCRWCLELRPSRVILTHLEEFGRGPEDYWHLNHAELIAARLKLLQRSIDVVSPVIGESIGL